MKRFLSECLSNEETRVVERWLYRRTNINRLLFEDYIYLFYSSALAVDSIEFKTGPAPDEQTLALLNRRHPGRTSFHVIGFRIVLRK